MSGIEQQACISGWGSATMVAPIWGYFDESGEHGKDGKLQRLTLGGFYAPWPELKRLCERWREALDAEGLASFHMTDIASDEYDYENWPSARQVRLNRSVDILCDHAISFGAFSYSTSGKRKVFADTYQHALGRVLIELEDICINSDARGNVVFAQSAEISNEMIGRYFDLTNWSGQFDGYAVRSSAAEPALQAAEIVARGLKRIMQDGLIPHSFQRLLLSKKPIRFWPPDPFSAISVPWRLGGSREMPPNDGGTGLLGAALVSRSEIL